MSRSTPVCVFEDATMLELFVNNVGLIRQLKNLSKKTCYLEAFILTLHVTASPRKGELEKIHCEHYGLTS